ncbi:isopentenyl transferase family protein [Streptomyces sp. ME19-01-6]|uniref:isopentenyl transferase family protein n=1 Tax=Streptomyces sp. ME19-01-6 TaxID=3028686 RepID=UPI0029B5EAEC|nr:isopentenyl transferase family protein [Streptomyces sp. ME19-01-6]MDX3227756.1 isopentenyl transferase family protein [Streptomyces sp. ME19-01-6]
MAGSHGGSPQFVHVIAGPTGVGKSAAATALARITGAPIVVADRIQCFTDLATTSARAGEETVEVERSWLGDRTVADGDYPSEEAADALVRRLEELGERHRFVIVEGGSISLLRDFAQRLPDLPYRLTARLLHVPDREGYLARLARRARRMLAPEGAQTSMLQELATLWGSPDHRFFAASVNGLEAILEWCATYSVSVESLISCELSEAQLEKMAWMVAERHAEHGILQDAIFSKVFSGMSSAAYGAA